MAVQVRLAAMWIVHRPWDIYLSLRGRDLQIEELSSECQSL